MTIQRVCIFIKHRLSTESVAQPDTRLPTLALDVFSFAEIVRTDRTQTSSRQLMTRCIENTKEEVDERERAEQDVCAVLMGESS